MSNDKKRVQITPLTPAPSRVVINHVGGPPPPPMAMAIRLSDAECDHIDMLRARSYELSVARGHMRRN
jgi:hypothetical protein